MTRIILTSHQKHYCWVLFSLTSSRKNSFSVDVSACSQTKQHLTEMSLHLFFFIVICASVGVISSCPTDCNSPDGSYQHVCLGWFPCSTRALPGKEHYYVAYDVHLDIFDHVKMANTKCIKPGDWRVRGVYNCEPSCTFIWSQGQQTRRLTQKIFDGCVIESHQLVCFYNMTTEEQPLLPYLSSGPSLSIVIAFAVSGTVLCIASIAWVILFKRGRELAFSPQHSEEFLLLNVYQNVH